MFAFELKTPDNRIEVFAFCTLAAVIDALVTIGIYAVLTRFYSDNRAIFYFFAAATGALCAVFFERLAFALGWWNYNEMMPIVPLLKVGLLPFVQLTMLVPLAIWLTKKFFEKFNG